jgi:hypothetical protein
MYLQVDRTWQTEQLHLDQRPRGYEESFQYARDGNKVGKKIGQNLGQQKT